jgi:hypothetical protein
MNNFSFRNMPRSVTGTEYFECNFVNKDTNEDTSLDLSYVGNETHMSDSKVFFNIISFNVSVIHHE